MKKENKILLLIVGLIVILLILTAIVDSKKAKQKNNEANNTSNETYFENSSVDKLAQMSERDRILFYFSTYIENVENGNYEVAYDMLYDEFKNTYFDNIEKFENYVKNKYPEIMSVDYESFKREGKYYIISTKILDITTEETFNQKFVLVEYDYNNFKLSFQAE